MLLPFQRLLICPRPNSSISHVLIAASGPFLYSYNAKDGTRLAKWTYLPEFQAKLEAKPRLLKETSSENSDRPVKRRRLSSGEGSETSIPEIITEGDEKTQRRKPLAQAPSITTLCCSSDGRYIVGVSGEDKTIRVLELHENGDLSQLSQRQMPKKPSSVKLDPTETTILSADKFGDVYSLPLHGQAFAADSIKPDVSGAEKAKPRQLAASEATVHTAKNRAALAQQMKFKDKNQPRREKTDLDFEHKLLLGHVSMLTDLLCLRTKVQGKTREYILTADRDEHIRVSRGVTQAHIIEHFLLGHQQFVNKLCVLPWANDILVSGGGDDYVVVWNWVQNLVVAQIDLKAATDELKSSESDTSAGKVAVTNIIAFSPRDSDKGVVAITLEKVSAVFILSTPKTSASLGAVQTIRTEGPVLDLVYDEEKSSLLYSMDSRANDSINHLGEISVIEVLSGNLDGSSQSATIVAVNTDAKTAHFELDIPSDKVDDIYYGVEHLRKRPKGVEGNEADEDNDEQ